MNSSKYYTPIYDVLCIMNSCCLLYGGLLPVINFIQNIKSLSEAFLPQINLSIHILSCACREEMKPIGVSSVATLSRPMLCTPTATAHSEPNSLPRGDPYPLACVATMLQFGYSSPSLSHILNAPPSIPLTGVSAVLFKFIGSSLSSK